MLVLTNCEGKTGMDAARLELLRNRSALDVVEQAIRVVEADPSIRTVGRGGAPNILGEVECDAAVMDGDTLRVGAVGALKGHLHAVSVARQVMERLPHVLLVGEGAARFAREVEIAPADMLTKEANERYQRWLEKNLPCAVRDSWPPPTLAEYVWASAGEQVKRDTVIFLARDGLGNLAGGTSSSGWPQKYPGRVGDSPLIGAGLYVDNRYGACACTHTGEMAIRGATARSVILYMKKGATVEEASREALDDLRDLKGGLQGPLVIFALDREGIPSVVGTDDLEDESVYWFWTEESSRIQEGRAEVSRRGEKK